MLDFWAHLTGWFFYLYEPQSKCLEVVCLWIPIAEDWTTEKSWLSQLSFESHRSIWLSKHRAQKAILECLWMCELYIQHCLHLWNILFASISITDYWLCGILCFSPWPWSLETCNGSGDSWNSLQEETEAFVQGTSCALQWGDHSPGNTVETAKFKHTAALGHVV